MNTPSTYSARACDTIARQLFYDAMGNLRNQMQDPIIPSLGKAESISALAAVANAAGYGFVDASEDDGESPLKQPAVNDDLMDECARAVYVRALSICRQMMDGSIPGDQALLLACAAAADAAASGFKDSEDEDYD